MRGRRLTPGTEDSPIVRTRVPEALAARLDDHARRRGVTRSEAIRDAIEAATALDEKAIPA